MNTNIFKAIIILAVILNAFSISYAQRDPELFKEEPRIDSKIDPALREAIFLSPIPKRQTEEKRNFLFRLFTSKAFAAAKDKSEERRQLREDWQKILGIDVFYPYFKAKEIEHVVKEKASFKIFDLKGRPEFSEDYNEVDYIFKKRF